MCSPGFTPVPSNFAAQTESIDRSAQVGIGNSCGVHLRLLKASLELFDVPRTHFTPILDEK